MRRSEATTAPDSTHHLRGAKRRRPDSVDDLLPINYDRRSRLPYMRVAARRACGGALAQSTDSQLCTGGGSSLVRCQYCGALARMGGKETLAHVLVLRTTIAARAIVWAETLEWRRFFLIYPAFLNARMYEQDFSALASRA